jgi:hypothetical protein
LKSPNGNCVPSDFRASDFDGNVAFQLLIASEIHDSKPTAAKLSNKLIPADLTTKMIRRPNLR